MTPHLAQIQNTYYTVYFPWTRQTRNEEDAISQVFAKFTFRILEQRSLYERTERAIKTRVETLARKTSFSTYLRKAWWLCILRTCPEVGYFSMKRYFDLEIYFDHFEKQIYFCSTMMLQAFVLTIWLRVNWYILIHNYWSFHQNSPA